MVTLPSVLTHNASAQFSLGLQQLVAGQTGAVEVDAAPLRSFDSSALAVLLECRRLALTAGKAFAVKGLPADLQKLATLYGIAPLLVPAA